MAVDPVYGFNQNDADALVRLIPGSSHAVNNDIREGIVPMRGYIATLTEALTGTEAACTITELSGEDPGVEGAIFKDPISVFGGTLPAGHQIICFYQDGFFWPINTFCPPE